MASAAEVRRAIGRLRSEFADSTLLGGLYGIRRGDSKTEGMWRVWRRKQIIVPGRGVHRAALEWFFQDEGLLPLKWAAARMGTTADGLTKLLEEMLEKGLLSRDPRVTDQLVDERVVRDLTRHLPSLGDRIFGDHDDMCRWIRRAAKQDLGIKALPALRSVPAKALGATDFASDFDCITFEPIGLRHQVWLDFGKPINLSPDVCGIHTYAEHPQLLSPFVMAGEAPTIPSALSGH
jgi:hypothetical protein